MPEGFSVGAAPDGAPAQQPGNGICQNFAGNRGHIPNFERQICAGRFSSFEGSRRPRCSGTAEHSPLEWPTFFRPSRLVRHGAFSEQKMHGDFFAGVGLLLICQATPRRQAQNPINWMKKMTSMIQIPNLGTGTHLQNLKFKFF